MFNVLYVGSVRRHQLKSIPKAVQARIKKYIENRIAVCPHEAGEPLKGTLRPFWKARVGTYRIIYEIKQKDIVVLVIKIGHRNNFYKRWRLLCDGAYEIDVSMLADYCLWINSEYANSNAD